MGKICVSCVFTHKVSREEEKEREREREDIVNKGEKSKEITGLS